MRSKWPLAYRTSLRLVGWFPPLAVAALFALLFVLQRWSPFEATPARLLEIVLPLGIAWHTAFLFSPADESPLEVLLACPRPLAWLVGERLAVVLLSYGLLCVVIALAFARSNGVETPWSLLLRWLTPSLALGALALLITVATRQGAIGFLAALFTWLAWLVQGDAIVRQWPFLQPFHLFLQPEGAAWRDYLLNRAALWGLSALLGWRTIRLLEDEGRLLGLQEQDWFSMFRKKPTTQSKEPVL